MEHELTCNILGNIHSTLGKLKNIFIVVAFNFLIIHKVKNTKQWI